MKRPFRFLALAVVPFLACQALSGPGDTGGLHLEIVVPGVGPGPRINASVAASAGQVVAHQNRVDIARVIIDGSSDDLSDRDTTGTPGESLTVEDLQPGLYAVALLGLTESEVELFGLREGVRVVAGKTTSARLEWTSFVPDNLDASAPAGILALHLSWSPVQYADGYQVEWDTASTFPNPGAISVVGTETQIAVGGPGLYSVRVRAVNNKYVGVSIAGRAARAAVVNNIPVTEAKLSFAAPPGDVPVNVAIDPAVVVEFRDGNGNSLTELTGPVTVALGEGSGGGMLHGTLTVEAEAGVARFADLSIDEVGEGYTLIATAENTDPAESEPFDVFEVARLVFVEQPSDTEVDHPIMPPVEVAFQDAEGQTLSELTGPVTVGLGEGSGSGGGMLHGTLTVEAESGVARFADLSIDEVREGYTLIATAEGADPAESEPFDVFEVARLVFVEQPSDTEVDHPIMPPVEVAFQDAAGNTLTDRTGPVTVGLGESLGGGMLHGTLTVEAEAGVARFADLSIDEVGEGYTLVATGDGAEMATSEPFDVFEVARLVFVEQPSDTEVDHPIVPPVEVAFQDAAGNTLTDRTGPVTVALGEGSGSGGGMLHGTLTVEAELGVVRFADLSIDAVGEGYTLIATADNADLAESEPFDVFEVARLVFVEQPSDTEVDHPIMPPVEVAFQDAAGNTLTDRTGPVRVALGEGSGSGGGMLHGTLTVEAELGVVRFADLSIDAVGEGYTLIATADNADLAESEPFDVLEVARLVFVEQPSDTEVDHPIMPPVEVAFQDAAGNTLTDRTGPVTVALGEGSGGGMLHGTLTVEAEAGVARFEDLSIDEVWEGYTLVATAGDAAPAESEPFDVFEVARLVFVVQPSDTEVDHPIVPPVEVAFQDAAGNTLTDRTGPVTVALGEGLGGGMLHGTLTVEAEAGVARFADLSIDEVWEGYTLVATAGDAAPAESEPFDVFEVARLVFVVQPSDTEVDHPIVPPVEVAFQDAAGNTLTDRTGPVTVALGEGLGGGMLHGTLTVEAEAGVARFADLSIDEVWEGYTLVATAEDAAPAASEPFDVFEVARLVFVVQPSDTEVDHPILPPVEVAFQDPAGNTLTDRTGPVTVALGESSGGGMLHGTLTVEAEAGVARFEDLSIDEVGEDYSLIATAEGAASTESEPFDAWIPKLTFVVQPSKVKVKVAIEPPVQVAFQDPTGNTLTGMSGMVTMTLGDNPGYGTLRGTLTIEAVNGIAMFADLTIDKKGRGYTLVATADDLRAVVSAPFDVYYRTTKD